MPLAFFPSTSVSPALGRSHGLWWPAPRHAQGVDDCAANIGTPPVSFFNPKEFP